MKAETLFLPLTSVYILPPLTLLISGIKGSVTYTTKA